MTSKFLADAPCQVLLFLSISLCDLSSRLKIDQMIRNPGKVRSRMMLGYFDNVSSIVSQMASSFSTKPDSIPTVDPSCRRGGLLRLSVKRTRGRLPAV